MRKSLPIIFFIAFLAMIPLASYSLLHWGTNCTLTSPCVIPVWFSPRIYAPSGVLFAGLAFVVRDLLQRSAGLRCSLLAVGCGTLCSYWLVNPELAFAGCCAYFLSELADTLVYTYLQQFNLIVAILLSAAMGLIIDSLVFLQVAFQSLTYLDGQIIGKLWMVLLSLPLIQVSRKYLTFN